MLHHAVVCMGICPKPCNPASVFTLHSAPCKACCRNTVRSRCRCKPVNRSIWFLLHPHAIFDDPVCRILPFDKGKGSDHLSVLLHDIAVSMFHIAQQESLFRIASVPLVRVPGLPHIFLRLFIDCFHGWKIFPPCWTYLHASSSFP